MEELKNYIRQYTVVDNALNQLNKKVHEMRIDRKDLEDKMGKALTAHPEIDKIKLDDNSHILVKHPMSHNKAWGISKSDLKNHLENAFNQNNGYLNADEIYDYIVREHSKKLVSTEFSFNRVVKE